MNRRSLSYNWREEDRLIFSRWTRSMVVFYGSAALLIFGLIVLTKPPSPAPDQATRLQSRFDITGARADESSAAIYPGRYAGNCKPAPIVGCACETDLSGSTRQLFQTAGDSNDHDGRIGGIEYLRMMEWLRATCTAVTRPGGLR